MIAPLKVGITGGIGSGKSTVCAVLKAMGHPVYNSDERAKTIMETSSEVREQLISVFGEPTFENNQLNRPYLAQAIFNDPAKREQINAIVHPVVRTDFQQWANSQTSSIIFQESALLIETGGHRNNKLKLVAYYFGSVMIMMIDGLLNDFNHAGMICFYWLFALNIYWAFIDLRFPVGIKPVEGVATEVK